MINDVLNEELSTTVHALSIQVHNDDYLNFRNVF